MAATSSGDYSTGPCVVPLGGTTGPWTASLVLGLSHLGSIGTPLTVPWDPRCPHSSPSTWMCCVPRPTLTVCFLCVPLPPGPLRGAGGQGTGHGSIRLRPLLPQRLHWGGAGPHELRGLGAASAGLAGAAGGSSGGGEHAWPRPHIWPRPPQPRANQITGLRDPLGSSTSTCCRRVAPRSILVDQRLPSAVRLGLYHPGLNSGTYHFNTRGREEKSQRSWMRSPGSGDESLSIF